MFIFRKARSPTKTLNDLDAYLNGLDDEPIKWLAREVSGWGNEFSYAELEAVIQSGQLDALIDWQGRYATVVNETFAPIWTAAMIAAAAKATRGMTVLSDRDWYVQSWIQNRGGKLISQLSEESRRAVMNIILRGQELHMAPRDVAKEIRPLIGLNARQAEANVNYREKVYQQFRDNGLSHTVAASRADKAAIKYAGKQHRYRAETIVLTENAFAYNRGAHMGVSQSIANGYMGRCEMVWTTAGTNRVCSRCLALKDTVVGHTDESGVTLPPLHPRCRCAIMYREIDTPRVIQPRVNQQRINPPSGILSGALKPESAEAEQHAFRYYGLVRSMKTDCRRIATNTGFREEDIQRIKSHVFLKEHELYDGEVARFYPSYHMAQSWQRLIDGRNIQQRDLVLLNHEFLESVLESEGLNAQAAHERAQRIYNYAELIK